MQRNECNYYNQLINNALKIWNFLLQYMCYENNDESLQGIQKIGFHLSKCDWFLIHNLNIKI